MSANSNQAIIELLVKDSASGQVLKVSTSVKSLKDAVAASGQTFDGTGGKANQAWQTMARGALSATGAIGSALGSMDSTVGKVIGDVADVGTAFAFGGPVAGSLRLVATALDLVDISAKQAKEDADKLLAPLKETRKQIEDLAELHGIAKMASEWGVSEEALRKYIGATKEGSDTAKTYNEAQTRIKEKSEELRVARINLAKATDDLNTLEDMRKQGAIVPEIQSVIDIHKQYQDQVNRLESDIQGLTHAQNYFADSGKKASDATQEASRTLEIYKQGLIGAAAENESYRKSVNDMATAHKKAMDGFTADWTTADTKAIADRIKAEKDAAVQIEDLRKNATEAAAERECSYARTVDELNRDIAQANAEYQKDRVKLVEDANADIERLSQDLQTTLDGINRDEVKNEREAKTYAQVQQLRDDAKAARDTAIGKTETAKKEVTDRLALAQQELDERKRQQDEEFRHRRELADADDKHQREVADRELRESEARIRKTETAAKQSIADQLTETQKAITKRREDEEASYKASTASATAAHNTKMQQLMSTETETQKLARAIRDLGPAHEPAIQEALRYKGILEEISKIPGPSIAQWEEFAGVDARAGSTSRSSGNSGWWIRNYGGGGDWVTSGPEVIRVGERGRERVQITPMNGAGSGSSGRTVQFVNCKFRSVDDVYAALDRADRGLA